MAYKRQYQDQEITVYINFGKEETTLPAKTAGMQKLLGNYQDTKPKGVLHLRPYEALVLEK